MIKNIFLFLLVILILQLNSVAENIAFISKDKNKYLDIDILGTINNKLHPRVILKNNRTGELKKYSIGDEFKYDGYNTFKVFHISDCFVSFVNGDDTITIRCPESDQHPNLIVRSSLSAFRITNYNDLFTTTGDFKKYIDKIIINMGKRYNVDQYLIKSVIKAESNFDPEAISPKNAQGMMQLIPSTAKDYGVYDPFDAEQNIEGGVRFLRDLIEFFKGDLDLVLAAYNAGPGTVMKYNYKIPPYPETKKYVKRVKRFYLEYSRKG